MQETNAVHVILAFGLVSGLCAGCGNSLVSEHKSSGDDQAAAQKRLAESRADQLRENVEIARKQSQNQIDAKAKELDTQKDALSQERKEVDRRADFWKKDLDQQEKAAKETSEHNAKELKTRIDNDVALGKYGRAAEAKQ